ncbi:LacI family DNA-binding transcriptional regulator [Cohnella nanjingensis]|uniref:LacI family DNA-binding transcriptional regulator n=1 Tax=Cohnella nanjingensis TaxID=1387779 RepID=A0A7X0RQA7_9BACL|nr:LacI family DNA-binding transcriptional regulator [Cohnella nanjingensis]MBB6670455.1 LacI family DNA-binding transcriptional regulator [Cohnella nanjingensis]
MSTIKDIARHAGVSVATVSYVLNNTRYVSPDKRERVIAAVQELNYVPNAAARGLRVRESRTIGLIVSDISNPFYPDLAKACEDVAQQYGYAVHMINTNDQPERMRQAVSQAREGKIDGLIVTTALEADRELLQSLLDREFPVVLAHRRLEGLDADLIESDNYEGGMLAARHMLALGHRRIAFLSGVAGSPISERRVAGYLQAMREAGIDVLAEWVLPGEAKYANSYERMVQYADMAPDTRPTAIINVSDIGAMGVLDAAADRGLRVPEDVAVMGFDDLFLAAFRSVRLTTVRIPRYELGRQATELLLKRIGKAKTERRHVVLPVDLVVRKTCGSEQADG